MVDVKAKFQELIRVFDPIFQPQMADAERSYVPETHEAYRAGLKAELELSANAKLLVAGQPGCGKTTLLLNMAQELRREGRVVAFVDLEAHTSVQDLDPMEMYLAALVELLREAGEASLGPETLAGCQNWLSQSQEKKIQSGELVSSFRSHLSTLRGDVAVRVELRNLVSQGIKWDPFSILCSALTDLTDRRPVVILDGLDKLHPILARRTFLEGKQKPMLGAPGVAILTIPLSVVYEPTFNVLSERYGNSDSAVLPAVRLWNFDPTQNRRTDSELGIGILRKIVNARVDPIDTNIVIPEATERAIRGSAGNIRELARLMNRSVVKAYVRGGTFIEVMDVEAAIADQRESFRRAYNPTFLPLLQRVRKEYRLDDSSDIARQLLYGLWVIEYRNGTAWYSLPEPVEQLLLQLERSHS